MRREALYRRGHRFPNVAGKIVVLVDDGLATGASMRAAIKAIRSRGPAEVIAAVPVASREACDVVATTADDCVCVITPEPLYGVGAWYVDFAQTSDDEVLALLDRADESHAADLASAGAPPED